MNCSRHNDRPAVGQCQHCGAGLVANATIIRGVFAIIVLEK